MMQSGLPWATCRLSNQRRSFQVFKFNSYTIWIKVPVSNLLNSKIWPSFNYVKRHWDKHDVVLYASQQKDDKYHATMQRMLK